MKDVVRFMRWFFFFSLQKRLCCLMLAALLSVAQGCAEFDTIRNRNDIAEYAEAVFRHQNQVTSRLMMSLDEALLDDIELRRAELAMHDACKLLNEYSAREMDGEPIGVLFKRRVRASIQGCDDSIRKVEAALDAY